MTHKVRSTNPHHLSLRISLWAGTRLAVCTAGLAVLAACAAPAQVPPGWPDTLERLLPTDVILLGEQHDAPEHHAMERTAVQWLAKRGVLSSVVIEMAPAGGNTVALGRDAAAGQVRESLLWDERLWPWANYSGAVMAAVRAGVPVLGGNLPREAMRPAMTDNALEGTLAAPAYAAQLEAVRQGHCDLLPESQLPGMVRIQIARDQSMASVISAAVDRAPGKLVLLVAGNGHVLRSRGIPALLSSDVKSKVVVALTGEAQEAMKNEADRVEITPALPPRDVCESLRNRAAAQGASPR